MRWNSTAVTPSLYHGVDRGAGVTGDDLTVAAQSVSDAAGNATAGSLGLTGGQGTVHANNLDGNVWFHVVPANWQNTEKGIFVADVVTAPTGNPANGGFMYSNAGAGTWRGSGGTITAFGPAGPRCSACGHDHWRHVSVNERFGSYLLECGMCGKVYKKGPADIRSQLEPHEKDEFVYEDGDPDDTRPPSKKRTIIEAVAHYQGLREDAEREASDAAKRAAQLAAGLAVATARVPVADAALVDAEAADSTAAVEMLDAQADTAAAETDCDSARAGVAVAAAALGVAAEKDKAAAEATLAAAQDDLAALDAIRIAAGVAQASAEVTAQQCAKALQAAQDAAQRAAESLASMAPESANAEAEAATTRAAADAIPPSFLSVWDSWRTLLASDEQDETPELLDDSWRTLLASDEQDETPELLDAEVARVDAEVDAWAATLGEEAP
jgi:hypothetical protein